MYRAMHPNLKWRHIPFDEPILFGRLNGNLVKIIGEWSEYQYETCKCILVQNFLFVRKQRTDHVNFRQNFQYFMNFCMIFLNTKWCTNIHLLHWILQKRTLRHWRQNSFLLIPPKPERSIACPTCISPLFYRIEIEFSVANVYWRIRFFGSSKMQVPHRWSKESGFVHMFPEENHFPPAKRFAQMRSLTICLCTISASGVLKQTFDEGAI
jgi:hypothetical protein